MSDALVRYDEACKTLSTLRRIDEVKDFRDKAESFRIFAKLAKNRTLEIDAAEIRIRAERRIGELMAAQREAGLLAKGGQPHQKPTGGRRTPVEKSITLSEAGIDKDLAKRARGLAKAGDKVFETEVSHWRAEATNGSDKVRVSFVKRLPKPEKKAVPPPELKLVGASDGKYFSVQEWSKLSSADKERIISEGFEAKGQGMNEQVSDAIEWARHSHNTVTGCLHGCPYCYARDIAERLYKPYGFAPMFHPARLSGPARVKVDAAAAAKDPAFKNVFANSMSDLFGQWVPTEWIEATIEMARRNPQWNFLTLTKFPQRAADFEFPSNWWMGTSVDAQVRVAHAEKSFAKVRCKTKWLSVEPLLEPLRFEHLDLFQWIVIGGASESKKTPKWVPPQEWVAELVIAAGAAGVRIYQKTNLDLPDSWRLRQFPWSKPPIRKLPDSFKYVKGL